MGKNLDKKKKNILMEGSWTAQGTEKSGRKIK